MKILWVDFTIPYLLRDADYPVGGWAVELRSWLLGAERTGNEAGVLTFSGARDLVGKELPFELVESFDPKQGVKYLKYLTSYIPAMQRALDRYQPDVLIQACASTMTGMAAYTAKRAGIPFVYRVANDMDVDERYRTRLRLYEQVIYRYGISNSDMILCQNRYQHEQVAAKFPGKPSALFPNPFGRDDFPQPRPLSERPYVAWLGIFQHQKNLPLLLNIARALPGIPFRIAGTKGNTPDAATDQALAGLEELPNVEFVGYLKRNEVMDFLGRAALLLNTSHYEGFSNTYLESFGCGTPVIARTGADPGGILGSLELGGSIDDEDDFPEAIANIFDMGSSYGELADRCQSYVRTEHDPAELTRRMVEALEPVVASR